MIKNWTKNHTYLSISCILAICILYGLIYFNSIQPLKAEVTSKKNEVNLFQKQYEKTLNETEEMSMEELERIDLLVPKQKSPENVLLNIRQIGENSGVTIDSIAETAQNEIVDEESSSPLLETSYSLMVYGQNMDEIHQFMQSMLESDRFILIEEMNVYASDEFKTLHLIFKTFYRE